MGTDENLDKEALRVQLEADLENIALWRRHPISVRLLGALSDELSAGKSALFGRRIKDANAFFAHFGLNDYLAGLSRVEVLVSSMEEAIRTKLKAL